MTQSVVVIRRPVTILLLLLVTGGMVMVTLWMSGKSYGKVDPIPFDDFRHLARRMDRYQVSTHLIAVIIVPVIANILLFVPWGFLMFLSLYTIRRPTLQTYILTLLLGLTFTCSIEAWQYFLPSRVADVNDVIWNMTGTFAGAILGHLRERLRFEFA